MRGEGFSPYIRGKKFTNLMTKPIFFLPILFFSQFSFAQKTKILGEEVEYIYRYKKDTTQNFYLALTPSANTKGLLLIIPGGFTLPKDFLNETDLPFKARKNGFVVVIPFLAKETFYLDSVSQNRLETLIPEVIKKYNTPANKFIIGGHSIGGHAALFYTEKSYQLNRADFVKPNLVFAVDPPLDMKRFWISHTYFKQLNPPVAIKFESEYILNKFSKEIGGSPFELPKRYEEISSFYREAKDGGNAKYLGTVPIRLYCDPDINWFIENWRAPYETLNLSDLAACIVQLKILGNANAELITNLGKGYFPGGRRHPHAFSQLNVDEFITWINRMLEKK
jgi:hypothetical protein